MARQEFRGRLDRQAWATAGLEAFAEGGPAAVAVEPVARRLGATKGSFYWHFADRQALLVAVLDLYEQESTESVITDLQRRPNPEDQLRSLFDRVFRNEAADPVYHVLLANASDSTVAPVLKRITTRRLDYLVNAISRLGYPSDDAQQRAIFAYSSWLGLAEMQRAMGGELFRSKEAQRNYLTFLQHLVLERPITAPR